MYKSGHPTRSLCSLRRTPDGVRQLAEYLLALEEIPGSEKRHSFNPADELMTIPTAISLWAMVDVGNSPFIRCNSGE